MLVELTHSFNKSDWRRKKSSELFAKISENKPTQIYSETGNRFSKSLNFVTLKLSLSEAFHSAWVTAIDFENLLEDLFFAKIFFFLSVQLLTISFCPSQVSYTLIFYYNTSEYTRFKKEIARIIIRLVCVLHNFHSTQKVKYRAWNFRAFSNIALFRSHWNVHTIQLISLQQ